MKYLRSLILILAISIIYISAYSQGYHVRIGTIGNSITEGTGLSNPLTQAYPAQLGVLLRDIFGDTCIVQNYGLTTTTMLKNGDVSYWDTQQFQDYLANAPEICFILLGTNDTKPQNWDEYGDEYLADYLAMIDTIKLRNSSTKFMLGYPPPAFEIKWGINDSIILNGVIPAIDSVLKVVDAELVDFYHPLLDSAYLFPDAIHPNTKGAGVMAKMILDRMIETDMIHKADTGLTFITSFKSAKNPLAINANTELSWTTINADSVFLNGELVETSGSINISPTETTPYTIIAEGEKSNDTIELIQEVYTPEVSRLRIYPATITRYEKDTIFFQVFLYDQYNILIEDTHYPVTWEITQGSGYLYGNSDTSVYYVAEQPDTIKLEVSYGELADVGTIYVKAVSTALENTQTDKGFFAYPNPCSNMLNIQLTDIHGNIAIKIFDLRGALITHKNIHVPKYGQVLYHLDVTDLPEGSYLIKIEHSGKIFTDRISVLKD